MGRNYTKPSLAVRCVQLNEHPLGEKKKDFYFYDEERVVDFSSRKGTP